MVPLLLLLLLVLLPGPGATGRQAGERLQHPIDSPDIHNRCAMVVSVSVSAVRYDQAKNTRQDPCRIYLQPALVRNDPYCTALGSGAALGSKLAAASQ
jgi:hypothetical protein